MEEDTKISVTERPIKDVKSHSFIRALIGLLPFFTLHLSRFVVSYVKDQIFGNFFYVVDFPEALQQC